MTGTATAAGETVTVDGAGTDPILVGIDSAPESVPVYATAEAAGADLRAAITAPRLMEPGERALLPTGVRLAIPAGFEGQVRPRSGLAVRSGVTVVNSPGTIDSDYRGEIAVLLINLGQEPVTIAPGMRIAQLVIAPVRRARFVPQRLDETLRGTGGFGSTGEE